MILQINIWTCEVCHRMATTQEETSPYSDPVVVPPDGETWDYVKINGVELLACPACVEAHPLAAHYAPVTKGQEAGE